MPPKSHWMFFFPPFQFPGWIVNSEGSVFITTANDNAVGMYTCTAYNSYGTMGRSEPTRVILKVRLVFTCRENPFLWVYICPSKIAPSLLQDPPNFKVPPRPEYLQEVGRELMIPCEATGDPTPNVTWSKVQKIFPCTHTHLFIKPLFPLFI